MKIGSTNINSSCAGQQLYSSYCTIGLIQQLYVDKHLLSQVCIDDHYIQVNYFFAIRMDSTIRAQSAAS